MYKLEKKLFDDIEKMKKGEKMDVSNPLFSVAQKIIKSRPVDAEINQTHKGNLRLELQTELAKRACPEDIRPSSVEAPAEGYIVEEAARPSFTSVLGKLFSLEPQNLIAYGSLVTLVCLTIFFTGLPAEREYMVGPLSPPALEQERVVEPAEARIAEEGKPEKQVREMPAEAPRAAPASALEETKAAAIREGVSVAVPGQLVEEVEVDKVQIEAPSFSSPDIGLGEAGKPASAPASAPTSAKATAGTKATNGTKATEGKPAVKTPEGAIVMEAEEAVRKETYRQIKSRTILLVIGAFGILILAAGIATLILKKKKKTKDNPAINS